MNPLDQQAAAAIAADITAGTQGVADLYTGAAAHSKKLRVAGPLRNAHADLFFAQDPEAKAAAQARVAKAARHPLEMARRVAQSPSMRLVGRGPA